MISATFAIRAWQQLAHNMIILSILTFIVVAGIWNLLVVENSFIFQKLQILISQQNGILLVEKVCCCSTEYYRN